MEKKMILSLQGQQAYKGQEPDTIELVTEGLLKKLPNGWELTYEESALTGLEGVHTSFMLEQDCVTLTRTGQLNSQMVFKKGVTHDSLYQMDFGALLIRVCANKIQWSLSFEGGSVDLNYSIQIENDAAGTVDYHLEVRPAG